MSYTKSHIDVLHSTENSSGVTLNEDINLISFSMLNQPQNCIPSIIHIYTPLDTHAFRVELSCSTHESPHWLHENMHTLSLALHNYTYKTYET